MRFTMIKPAIKFSYRHKKVTLSSVWGPHIWSGCGTRGREAEQWLVCSWQQTPASPSVVTDITLTTGLKFSVIDSPCELRACERMHHVIWPEQPLEHCCSQSVIDRHAHQHDTTKTDHRYNKPLLTHSHLVLRRVVVDSGPGHVEVASRVGSQDHNVCNIGVAKHFSQG